MVNMLIVLFKNFILYLVIQIFFTIVENIAVSIYADKCYPFLKFYSSEKLTKQQKKNMRQDAHALSAVRITKVSLLKADTFVNLV